MKKENNYAFIDAQNLTLSVRSLGWILDFIKFRIYLSEKYFVTKAFMFLGYLERNKDFYKFLKKAGYTIVFKPTIIHDDGSNKGNCDAEMVLHSMIELENYDKAVIISGDGDFQCLVKHLLAQNKLKSLLVPNRDRYSALLKLDEFIPYTRFVSNHRTKLEYIKERPQ